jgi:hypothetical protein
MAVVTYSALGTRSANLAGTALDNKANGSVSDVITYDNSVNQDLYALITVKLGGSITPTTNGSITLRAFYSDGTDDEDIAVRDGLSSILLTGAGAKIVTFDVLLKPCEIRFIVVNNSGTTFAISGNEFYVTPYNEEAT